MTVSVCFAADSGQSEIRIGYPQDPLTLDPSNHRDSRTETVIRNLYDGLFTRDMEMKVVPELVEKWKQINPLTYEFTLRKGVHFHNGSLVTAKDVQFTFERMINENAAFGQTSPRKSLLGPLAKVEVVNEDTVRFHLSKPWPVLISMLPFQQVISEVYANKMGKEGLALHENGIGPYRLVEWHRGEGMVMERFADYYGGAADIPPVSPPRTERVIWKIIPETASRVIALLAGGVDIITDLPAYSMELVEKNPHTKVLRVNGTRSFFIALNNSKPPFDDIRVRKAMNYALNKKLIIDKIYYGTATSLNGVLSPDAFAFDKNLPAYDFSLEQADKLLAEAGYKKETEITLDAESSEKGLAEAIAALLTEAGITTSVQLWEASVIKSMWTGKSDRDMYLTSWGNASLDPYDIMDPTLMTGGRGNFAGYSNKELDKILTEAGTESDPVKRKELYTKAQEIVNRDVPWVFLWLPQTLYGVNSNLKGWTPTADGRINLHDAYIAEKENRL